MDDKSTGPKHPLPTLLPERMGATGRRLRRHFLCFGVADAVAEEAEAAVKEISVTAASGSEPELRQRRSLRRIKNNFLRSLPSIMKDQSSSRSPLCDDRKSETVCTTSASSFSSSSSSSLSSNSSMASSSTTSDSSDSFREAATVVRLKTELKPSPATATAAATDLVSPPFGRRFDPARGLCLLLVSLMVMMFCGRLCAILWTSMWLCLVPIRNAVVGVPKQTPLDVGKEAIATAEIPTRGCDDSDKKRVVLEGLLERNRRI